MQLLETKIPPPLVALLIGLAMWPIARLTPALPIDPAPRLILAAIISLSGFTVAASAFVAFKKAKTTVNPNRPDTASTIVTGGVFGYTRNPMYVGLVCQLTAWAIWLSAPVAILGPVVFVLFTRRFQIIPEERALLAKFGDEYVQYRKRVRRWV